MSSRWVNCRQTMTHLTSIQAKNIRKNRAKAKIVKKRKEHNNKTVNINEMEYESKTSNLEQKQTYEEERRRLESRREQATS